MASVRHATKKRALSGKGTTGLTPTFLPRGAPAPERVYIDRAYELKKKEAIAKARDGHPPPRPKSKKRLKIEGELIEGEEPVGKIARLNRVDSDYVFRVRGKMEHKVSIPHIKVPSAKLARVYYRLMVLESIGVEKGRIELAASDDMPTATLFGQLRSRTHVRADIRDLYDGKYWRDAQFRLAKWTEAVKKNRVAMLTALRAGLERRGKGEGLEHRYPKRLKGKEEAFAERAVRLGIGSVAQLSEYTGVPKQRIYAIMNRILETGKPLHAKSFKQRRIDFLLVQGEHTPEEIARATRVSRDWVVESRTALKREGIPTNLKGAQIPIARLARAAYRLSVLQEKKPGLKKFLYDVAAGNDMENYALRLCLSNHPNLIADVKRFAGGRHWKQAVKEHENWDWRLALALKRRRLPKTEEVARLLIKGELTTAEIAAKTGADRAHVYSERQKLHKEGIQTLVPNINAPPLKLARMIHRLQVLESLGFGRGKITMAAGNDMTQIQLSNLLGKNPGLREKIRELDNGRYWKQAGISLALWEGQLRLNPPKETIALVLFRLDVLRKLRPGAENAVRTFAEKNIVADGAISRWLEENPGLVGEMKRAQSGKLWQRTIKKSMAWIREQEKYWKRKYKPEPRFALA